MPNHVHVLFEVWTVPLGEVLRSWKKFSALRINRMLGRTGRLWQQEYWDRYMRDEEHFNRARRYVESNPVKAALCAAAADLPWSSANPKWVWQDALVGARLWSAQLCCARLGRGARRNGYARNGVARSVTLLRRPSGVGELDETFGAGAAGIGARNSVARVARVNSSKRA